MAKYKTIQEVVEAVKDGREDESKLEVIQDNDCSHIYNGPAEDADGNKIEDTCIFRGMGYGDTDALWELVFPKATVMWW